MCLVNSRIWRKRPHLSQTTPPGITCGWGVGNKVIITCLRRVELPSSSLDLCAPEFVRGQRSPKSVAAALVTVSEHLTQVNKLLCQIPNESDRTKIFLNQRSLRNELSTVVWIVD